MPLRLGPGETGVAMVLHDITALRQLEQVRTEFVANVSHELRTPLTAIQGYLETLLGGALDDPAHARRFLEVVFRHTERLGRLLNDLTDLSNIELGRVSLQRGAGRARRSGGRPLAIIRAKADAGGVRLEARLPAELPAVQADRDRLAQILINLVDNAVKYTPRGGQVAVERGGGGGPGGGGGGRYRRRHPAPRTCPASRSVSTESTGRARASSAGPGLGLAIVKHLVLAHGGTLVIESRPGEGTRVRVTLPAAPPPA